MCLPVDNFDVDSRFGRGIISMVIGAIHLGGWRLGILGRARSIKSCPHDVRDPSDQRDDPKTRRPA